MVAWLEAWSICPSIVSPKPVDDDIECEALPLERCDAVVNVLASMALSCLQEVHP